MELVINHRLFLSSCKLSVQREDTYPVVIRTCIVVRERVMASCGGRRSSWGVRLRKRFSVATNNN